jgi:hypothetical protein
MILNKKNNIFLILILNINKIGRQINWNLFANLKFKLKVIRMNSNNILYHIVYKTTNLINKKIYIGIHSAKTLMDEYIGSGTDLQKDVKKLGKENFKRENIFIFESREDALKKEKELVDYDFIKRHDTYNKMLGGKAGKINHIVCKHKDDICEKPKHVQLSLDDPLYLSGEWIPSTKNISGWNEGNKNPMFGKKQSEKTKKLISKKNKETHDTDEFRKKNSLNKKKWWSSLSEEELEKYKIKMSNVIKAVKKERPNPPLSEESKKILSQKASIRQLGKKRGPYKKKTEEQKRIIAEKIRNTLNSYSEEKRAEINRKKSEGYKNINKDKKIEMIKKMSERNTGEKNLMFGKSYYSIWVEKYGKDKADIMREQVIKKTNEKKEQNKLKKINQNG